MDSADTFSYSINNLNILGSEGLAAAKSLQSCPTLCDPRRQPTRLPCPWDSPGKNTEVGCHFLLQCMKVKSESEVTQLCPTLRNPTNCSLPGSGIFQARVLEWVAIAFSSQKALLANICEVLALHQALCSSALPYNPETHRLAKCPRPQSGMDASPHLLLKNIVIYYLAAPDLGCSLLNL